MEKLKEILEQVNKIEIKTQHLVRHLLKGDYSSVFKGSGFEFYNFKEYSLGDDKRHIDYKISKKHNKKLVREYKEERDLQVYFLFDMSSSTFSRKDKNIRQKSIEIIASLMITAAKKGDSVGLCIFSETIEEYFSPKKGKRYALYLITCLLNIMQKEKFSRGTNLNNVLLEVANRISKRSVIFIFSDFISEDFTYSLRVLMSKHDVIPVWVKDIPNWAINRKINWVSKLELIIH